MEPDEFDDDSFESYGWDIPRARLSDEELEEFGPVDPPQ